MTGYFEGGPNNQIQSSGVFYYVKETGSQLEASPHWHFDIVGFNGSYGFSGYTSSAGSHSHTMALDNTGGNEAHKLRRVYVEIPHSGSTSSADSHDHSRGTIGNSMTGSTGGLCWPRDEDRSGVFTEYFSNRKIPDGVSYTNSAVRFNGSYGFSGYTSSAGSHDHSRGTIGNSMTGYFSIRPNCYDSVSGVFSRTSSSSCGVVYGSKDSGAWGRHSFNGSYGFSG